MRQALQALFVAMAILVAAAAPAGAQPQPEARFLADPPPDEVADATLAIVMENIHLARDESGQLLPPLSDAQRSEPLLDRALLKEVIDVGFASGLGQVCGLNWTDLNFLQMMNRERTRGDRSAHQLAAIALVHGIIQTQAATSYQCNDSLRLALNAFYERKWGGEARR